MGYELRVKYFNSFWLKKVVGESQATNNTTIDHDYGVVGNLTPLPTWPGLPWNPDGYPEFPWGNTNVSGTEQEDDQGRQRQWFVEEARIKGGFNNTSVDFGVRAYITEEEDIQQNRISSLIYSGIYNSRTGINNTNVFSIGEDITKTLDPANGSIQKLFAEDTNLTIFQENKVSKALIDKDAIYTAEGQPLQNSSNVVIGQIVPYLGEYGISTNPESFAVYGFAKYFADRYRSTVLRLSRDGITEIAEYGMRDYFRDTLSTIDGDFGLFFINAIAAIPGRSETSYFDLSVAGDGCSCCSIQPGMTLEVYGEGISGSLDWINTGLYVTNVTELEEGCRVYFSFVISEEQVTGGTWDDWDGQVRFRYYEKDKILGGWDIYGEKYELSIQPKPRNSVNCTTPRVYYTLGFDESINGWISFYSYKPTDLGSLKNNFYSFDDYKLYVHYDQTTLNNRTSFYGDKREATISFIFNPNPSIVKNFQTVNYEGSNGWRVDSIFSDSTGFDQLPYPATPVTIPPITSTTWGEFFDDINPILSYEQGYYIDPNDGLEYRAGFNRRENKYVANLVNDSLERFGEVVSPDSMSGIKGYYTTLNFSTDDLTDVGGLKQLWSVSGNFVVSSL